MSQSDAFTQAVVYFCSVYCLQKVQSELGGSKVPHIHVKAGCWVCTSRSISQRQFPLIAEVRSQRLLSETLCGTVYALQSTMFRELLLLTLASFAFSQDDTPTNATVTDEDMGPAAFMWPPDRVWSGDMDNRAPCGSRAPAGNRTEFPLSMPMLCVSSCWEHLINL
jgi:hypothetical protein